PPHPPQHTTTTSSSVTSTAADSGFSLSSMFSPLTQSVSDMAGLSGLGANPQILRIIPDPRANCLYVTGPRALVDEAESLLQVLDSNQMPESLRDLQPRRIAVEYAEIDDISTIVNDAFKPYMEPSGGRGGQQNNPMAALFGGGQRGGGGNEPQGVQMTVAVDRQNSTLIISSSLNLFERVESLVKELDDAAKQSNRTVRVVQLQHADASMVQQSLTSLFPRVTTSSTRSTSSSSSSDASRSSSAPSQPPSSGSGANPFQQMMMDRMRSGEGSTGRSFRGGSSPFGGRSSGSSPFGSRGGFGGFGSRGGR
ncbi:MAG: secretin N-terminal domain-containing protein, partial [Planctomycetaceae bacterium]